MSWQPVGDPTVLGWTITVAYAVTAWRCWQAHATEPALAVRRFWWFLTMALAFLALNKQLDLQVFVTGLARTTAKNQGWYSDRKPLQMVAVGFAALVVSFFASVAVRMLRPNLARLWPALTGVVVLGLYASVRMTSLHELDALVVRGPFPMKWWMELLGLALIFWATTKRAEPRT